MIEAYQPTKRYGKKTAVDRLDFVVRPGTVTGFLGRTAPASPPPCAAHRRRQQRLRRQATPTNHRHLQHRAALRRSARCWRPSRSTPAAPRSTT